MSDHHDDPEKTPVEPSWTKPCDECGEDIARYPGEGDISCPREDCFAQYNAFGQKLRSNWASNPSSYDEDISDLDGYEMSFAGEDYY